jgi:hypothetical protein
MEWQRVLELHDGIGDGLHGSGYLLGPRLALTARHVVEGLQVSELRLLEADEDGLPGGIGAWQKARVVWRGHGDLDLALLAPADAKTSFRELRRNTQLARLDGREPVPVDALGFPRAMLEPSHSDTLHIEARINAWSGVRGEALLLNVITTRPASGEGWKGMSGAAVFGGDRLVGVIQRVPIKFDESSLRAIPAHALFDSDTATKLLRKAKIELSKQFVDAAYVAKLPSVGHWGGAREQYARAVVTTLCRIDHIGLAVAGAPDRRTPALAAFSLRRFQRWPDGSPGLL